MLFLYKKQKKEKYVLSFYLFCAIILDYMTHYSMIKVASVVAMAQKIK